MHQINVLCLVGVVAGNVRSDQTLEAAENGDNDVLRELLAEDPSLVNAVDEDGYTPLHRAAYNGHTEAAQACIVESH